MFKTLSVLSLVIGLSCASLAQKVDSTANGSANNATSVSQGGEHISLESGTQIAAQLQNSINAEKAKVGDQVVLKTTKAVKQNGEVVVAKGSKLIGHVTEVQERAKGNTVSKIGILFDKLEHGGSVQPITATIVSVMQAQSALRAGDVMQSDISGSGSASTTAQSSSGGSTGGGLLGGVGSTVGGVLNTTTQTVGSVASTAGQTLGSTTNTLGSTLRGVQISNSTSASANGGSTLSLTGSDLRLEKGTTFNLSVSGSGSLGNTAEQN